MGHQKIMFPKDSMIQKNWLVDENNNIIVDFVGRLENINNDYKIICDNIGVKYSDVKNINSSKRNKDYRIYYDNETIDIVYNLFKVDFDEFGYNFE